MAELALIAGDALRATHPVVLPSSAVDYDAEQIEKRRPGGEIAEALGAGPALQWLLDYARRGGRDRARAIAALVAWKAAFERASDHAALLELDRVAEVSNIAELRTTQRQRLLCDPLGSADGLDERWQSRLSLLRRAVAGEHALDSTAVGVTEPDEDPGEIEFHAPDPRQLYRTALRFEQASRRPFSRTFAAVWSITNGISIDGDPFLAPIGDWDGFDASEFTDALELSGTRIGCGHYCQGSLVVQETDDDPLGGPVVDIDDDGIEHARYASLGELLDTLLGVKA